jgi:multidrug efflux pump subunit AcrA (membrane-fusion protein)
MFVSVQIASELAPSALLVPDSAVLRSGQKNTVFLALDGGKFDARTVVLGPEGENGMYQVASGLNEGDRVVTSGQFMLDSESQLNEAIEKMREGAGKGTAVTIELPRYQQ